MPQTGDMRVQLKLVLHCAPDAAWEAIRSPEVFREVSSPVLSYEPIGADAFPDRWPAGERTIGVSLFSGLVPLGEQTLDLSFREVRDVRIVTDDGGPVSGPLTAITRWRHRMAVAPGPDGSTLYRDRLEFSAGLLTIPVWFGLWWFWQRRGRRLVKLAPGFGKRFHP